MIRRCVLLCCCLCLSSCHQSWPVFSELFKSSPTAKPVSLKAAAHPITQTRTFQNFSQVIVKGPINVNLHTGSKRSQVILHGAAEDLTQVSTRLKYNTLDVQVGEGYPHYGALTIDIYTPRLNAFTFDGVGVIKGIGITTQYLDLSITNTESATFSGKINLHRLAVYGPGIVRISDVTGQNIQVIMVGNPNIQIVGMMNFGLLDLRGDGFFSAYWVKSDRLVIKEHGNVHLQLAGVAKVLEVTLWDHADFNGRYLRAYRAFVKTHGHATAKISAVRRQHTLASEASDIYYYNLPEMKTDFMAFNGSVLDMRDWNLYYEQEYTRYNEQY